MTLTVKGPTDFTGSVASALKTIGPCWSYEFAPPNQGLCEIRVSRAPAWSSYYCRYRAGANLIKLLVDARDTFTVNLGHSGAYHLDDNEIYWSPTDIVPTDNPLYHRLLPASILAHELVHAWLDLNGHQDRDEHAAVRGENHIRHELGVPPRKTYSGQAVPDYDGTSLLNTDDREDCGCARPSLGWRGRQATYQVLDTINAGRWEVCRAWGRLKPDGRPDRTPFDSYAQSVDSGLRAQYASALGVRAQARHRKVIDGLARAREGAPVMLRLESVSIGGAYRVLFVAEADGGLILVTNLVIADPPNEPFAGGPEQLCEFRLTAPAAVARLRELVAALEFQEGGGGDPKMLNGAVEFLQLSENGNSRSTALFGCTYRATHGSWRRPPQPDALRWDAIEAAYDLGRDLVRTAAEPCRRVARSARRTKGRRRNPKPSQPRR